MMTGGRATWSLASRWGVCDQEQCEVPPWSESGDLTPARRQWGQRSVPFDACSSATPMPSCAGSRIRPSVRASLFVHCDELERLADIGHVAAGTVIQEEGRAMPWSYCILDGMALVESSGSHLAAVPAGAWLLGCRPGKGCEPRSWLQATWRCSASDAVSSPKHWVCCPSWPVASRPPSPETPVRRRYASARQTE